MNYKVDVRDKRRKDKFFYYIGVCYDFENWEEKI